MRIRKLSFWIVPQIEVIPVLLLKRIQNIGTLTVTHDAALSDTISSQSYQWDEIKYDLFNS